MEEEDREVVAVEDRVRAGRGSSMAVTTGHGKVRVGQDKVRDKEEEEDKEEMVGVAGVVRLEEVGPHGPLRTLGGGAPGTRTCPRSGPARSTGILGKLRTSVWSPSPVNGKILFRPGHQIIEGPASSERTKIIKKKTKN